MVTLSPLKAKRWPSKGAWMVSGPATRVMRCIGETSNCKAICLWQYTHSAEPA